MYDSWFRKKMWHRKRKKGSGHDMEEELFLIFPPMKEFLSAPGQVPVGGDFGDMTGSRR
jgi:hypothetical protein